MKNPIYIFGSILIISILASCTSGAAKKAALEFKQVDSYVAAKDLSTALQLLDSIISWNPNDYGISGEALRRRNSIAKDFHKTVIESSESLVKDLEPRIAALSKDFILTPGEGGMAGTYEHKRQTTESSWNRTFLKIGLNEKGDVWLISHYFGTSWIDHTSVRVYDQDQFIVTDTIGLGHEWNRKVEDQKDKWETIEFREGSDAGAIAFIADNYLKSVKARLTGKTFNYIVLEGYDKEAFRKGWELAQLLKERYGLRETIKQHQSELRKLGVQTGAS